MSLPTHFQMKVAGGKTVDVPTVGYGTWASGGTDWCKNATLAALKAGYRHLDCAWFYGVDQQVGEAIRESGIPREEIFITSKFWPNFAAPENVEVCLDLVLKNMGLDYIDLFLSHWPLSMKPTSTSDLKTAKVIPGEPNAKRAIAEEDGKIVMDWDHCVRSISAQAGKQGSFIPTWKAMQALVSTGKARAVGVSNFSITQVKELLPYSEEVPVSCCQDELHPWLPLGERVAFMHEHGIVQTCYSPFAGQKSDGETLLKDKTVLKLAEDNAMDVGQLLQSWAVQRGTIPLGKSQTESRIKSNLAIKKLSDKDMKALDDLALPNNEGRTINPGPAWGVKLFED